MRKTTLFRIYNLLLYNKIPLLLIFYGLAGLSFISLILDYKKAFFFCSYKIINKIGFIVLLYAILLVVICFAIKYKSCCIHLAIPALLIILKFTKHCMHNFIILKNNLIYFLFRELFLKRVLLLFWALL